MEAETRIDMPQIVRGLTRLGARYVIIGRQAVRLYGSPVFTHDFDLWFDPACREDVLRWFQDLDLELTDAPDGDRPIVRVLATIGRIDAFFARSMTNQEGERLEFDDIHARARILEDPAEHLSLHVPDIDDLVATKKMRRPNAKDQEDIRYLLVRKDLERRGDLPDDSPHDG